MTPSTTTNNVQLAKDSVSSCTKTQAPYLSTQASVPGGREEAMTPPERRTLSSIQKKYYAEKEKLIKRAKKDNVCLPDDNQPSSIEIRDGNFDDDEEDEKQL